MPRARVPALLCSLSASFGLAAAGPAAADPYPGGGLARTDCFAYFDAPVNYPPTSPRRVRCTDGDPSCDAGGAVDGICRIPVAVCANVTGAPRCTPSEVDRIVVDHALDNGDPRFDTDFQALQSRINLDIDPPTTATDVCTTPVLISVRVLGPNGRDRCARTAKRLRLVSTPPLPDTRRDGDRLRLECEPATCDPTVLFDGTFDRIQSQVFDLNCAISGCHDSQSLSGGLTVERGSAYGALVGVVPDNAAAAGLGWQRVTPGSVATSLLHHKLAGPRDPSLGSRMPLGKPRLPAYLRGFVDAWIAAGAPEMGWVPGTD